MFWREPEVWPVLAHLLRGMGRPVRVWCGASHTGEEPYTVAALLHLFDIPGEVWASDGDSSAVAYAGGRRYPYQVLRNSPPGPPAWGSRVLDYDDDAGTVTIRGAVADRVKFAVRRLGVDPPPPCDVALVRNVWHRLGHREQRQLAEDLAAALPADGRLVLGKVDMPTVASDFGGLGFAITLMMPGNRTPPAVVERFEQAELRQVWRVRHR